MFPGLGRRLSGVASISVREKTRRSAELAVKRLTESAFLSWADEGLTRYNDREASFTVMLYSSCLRILQEEAGRYPLVRVEYEAPQPTEAMLHGLEDVSRAPRPDLKIVFGIAEIRLEAKLLKLAARFANEYVNNGMMRFIDGRYSSTHSIPGFMFGYVLEGALEVSLERVNDVISRHPNMADDEQLNHPSYPEPRMLVTESLHKPELRLVHYMFDMRAGMVISPDA